MFCSLPRFFRELNYLKMRTCIFNRIRVDDFDEYFCSGYFSVDLACRPRCFNVAILTVGRSLYILAYQGVIVLLFSTLLRTWCCQANNIGSLSIINANCDMYFEEFSVYTRRCFNVIWLNGLFIICYSGPRFF